MGAPRRTNRLADAGSLAATVLMKAIAGEEVALDRLESELGEAPRYDIVAALNTLEKLGAGKFLSARSGRKARFAWSGQAAVNAARASLASGQDKAAQRKSSKTAPSPKPSMLDHTFHVRAGVLVSWRLPADVTRAEIERLCQFLQTLPFR